MKKLSWLMLILTLVACGPAVVATPTVAPSPSSTLAPATVTATSTETPTPQTPTATLTLTPPIPLGSEEAKATIQALLREPVDCAAPCFWGIMPGQTTLGEAWNIFTLLGIQHLNTTYRDPAYKGMRLTTAQYDFLSMRITLVMRDDIVMNLHVRMTPEEQKAGIAREWLAYSPERLIYRYGQPSKVDLALDRGPNVAFAMIMYFDEYDLIVIYGGNQVVPRQAGSFEVCPLTAQFDMVWLWMGKDPIYPPGSHVPLEKATGMTLEEFSKLMTGDSNEACFTVKGEEFLP